MHYYNVGRIMRTHGVKGEVKVNSVTDFPKQRFRKGQILYLVRQSGKHLQLRIDRARSQMNFVLLHFRGYDSINAVQFMRGKQLQVSEQGLSSHDLQPGEYYFHQIIGLTVYDMKGKRLGKIVRIMKTGANDVWVVQRPRQKSLLLPKISQVIKKIDLKHHLVRVQLMKGLDSL